MKHYHCAIDYLTYRMLASMSHVQMWVYIEDGMFENAMTSQFNFLNYKNIADELFDDMTGQQKATMLKLFDIAYGGL